MKAGNSSHFYDFISQLYIYSSFTLFIEEKNDFISIFSRVNLRSARNVITIL
jgi:hypothetical protein